MALPRTLDELRAAIGSVLGADPGAIADDDDLIGWGLDSIRMMSIANAWRRGGAGLKFADLIELPTVSGWWRLLSSRLAAPDSFGAGDVDEAAADVDEAAPFGLTAMQQAYWIGRGEDQALGGVNAHYYVELDGAGVDPVRLERAARALFRRHGMLRARFGDDSTQQILPDTVWPGVTVHDLRSRLDDEAAGELGRLREGLSRRRLRVGDGEVFDLQLSLLRGGATRLHINIDMLVADANSFRIILDDLAHLYDRPDEPLAPIGYSFPRYLAEQESRRAAGRERDQAYWQERISEMAGPPQLPLAAEPDLVSGQGVTRVCHQLPASQWRQLEARARDHGLTLPAVFVTAFAETIAAWTPEPGFVLSLPLFDREHINGDVPAVVGDFTSLLILSVDVSGELPFAQRGHALQRRLRADLRHLEYPGVEVLRDMARQRQGDWVLAPVVFTSAIGIGELFGPQVRRCFGTPGWTTSQTPQVWLDQQVTERDGGLFFNWDFVAELFPDGLVSAMFGAYLRLVQLLAASDQAWEGPLPALLPAGQADVRAAVNATAWQAPAGLLHEQFVAQAGRRPDALALAWGEDSQVSYGELYLCARKVAGRLAVAGMQPGDLVGVTLPRGRNQVEAVLGVLLAGGAYVPVGIGQPAHRRAVIYGRAGVRIVLTTAALRASDGWPPGLDVIAIDEAATAPPADPAPGQPDALAYVIYTSGSTGEPKGVEITHRSALNTIDDINDRFGVGESDRILAVSALDFDLSVYDIFGPLRAGGAVVLVGEDDRREGRRWAGLVERWHVTLWNSVPALLDMLLHASAGDGLGQSLRLALVSGDWVGLDLPGRLRRQLPGARLVALGGATEAAIWSNACEVAEVPAHWRSIPYGFPLRNQKYRVVDSRGRDCPDWVPGELWIGGTGVARGYRADPQATARQFVSYGGERWYRTGDLGRYWPDGMIEFLGRADNQIKIRGHRIELGDVEAALEAHADVARAVATTVAVAAGPQAAGPRRLAAVVVPRTGSLDLAAIRSYLAGRLPSYLVPAYITAATVLPTNSNGKIDRQAVSHIVAEAVKDRTGGQEPPAGAAEAALARLWCELLQVPAVGRDDSFFELGGDSLLATRLLDAIRRRFGVDATLRRLFATPTVRDLAVLIAAELDGKADAGYEEGVI
jgi:amino acid adenylation domain-containing protein